MRTLLRLVFWCLLAALIGLTLVPIGARPKVGPADLERALAYAGFGLVAGLAYPRHRLAMLAAIVAVAACLEIAQAVTVSRHGRVVDFLVKVGGGAAGWLGAWAWALGMRWASARGDQSSTPA